MTLYGSNPPAYKQNNQKNNQGGKASRKWRRLARKQLDESATVYLDGSCPART